MSFITPKLFVGSICAAAALMILPSYCGQYALAAKPNNRPAPKQDLDWQAEQDMAMEYEQEGRFTDAEKSFFRAKKKLLREFNTAPPSSFSARWCPLQESLRHLYLDRAVNHEDDMPFGTVDDCYKKALNIPGTTYQMWETYADFLRRHHKEKEALKVEKEGKKKCLYRAT